MINNRRVGRPLGFKLSENSKRAIRESKRGQRHKEETKVKISKSLHIYFRCKNPLSVELLNMYCKFDDEECNELFEWINGARDDIDNSNNIMTNRAIRNKCKAEITYGSIIECFGHNVNPEFILLTKEYCKLNNIDINDFFSEIL